MIKTILYKSVLNIYSTAKCLIFTALLISTYCNYAMNQYKDISYSKKLMSIWQNSTFSKTLQNVIVQEESKESDSDLAPEITDLADFANENDINPTTITHLYDCINEPTSLDILTTQELIDLQGASEIFVMKKEIKDSIINALYNNSPDRVRQNQYILHDYLSTKVHMSKDIVDAEFTACNLPTQADSTTTSIRWENKTLNTLEELDFICTYRSVDPCIITHIDVSNNYIYGTVDIAHLLQLFPNLQKLNISHNAITKLILPSNGLPSNFHLISNTNFIKNICRADITQKLQSDRQRVTAQNAPKFIKIDLYNNAISGTFAVKTLIDTFSELTAINISNNEITELLLPNQKAADNFVLRADFNGLIALPEIEKNSGVIQNRYYQKDAFAKVYIRSNSIRGILNLEKFMQIFPHLRIIDTSDNFIDGIDFPDRLIHSDFELCADKNQIQVLPLRLYSIKRTHISIQDNRCILQPHTVRQTEINWTKPTIQDKIRMLFKRNNIRAVRQGLQCAAYGSVISALLMGCFVTVATGRLVYNLLEQTDKKIDLQITASFANTCMKPLLFCSVLTPFSIGFLYKKFQLYSPKDWNNTFKYSECSSL